MMKKAAMLFLILIFSAGLLSAKISLTLDVGPLFTHFVNSYDDGSARHRISANLGGVNALLQCTFAKNFGVYGMTNFAFGNTYWAHRSTRRSYSGYLHELGLVYAIDSQYGFFYSFKPQKNLAVMLGFGFGLGGNGFKRVWGNQKQNVHCTNIGGGINVDVSYMFTKMIGIYGGVSDTLYAPVSVSVKDTNKEKSTTYSGSEIQSGAGVGKISNSFSLKTGIQITF